MRGIAARSAVISLFVGPFDAHLYGTLAIFAEAPLLFRLLLRVLRGGLFCPWAKSHQVVRGHACGHPARNYFGERRPAALASSSLPLSWLEGGCMSARLDELLVWTSALG